MKSFCQHSGSWDSSKRAALECLAMDLAQLLMIANHLAIPSDQKGICNAFSDEIKAMDIGITDADE